MKKLLLAAAFVAAPLAASAEIVQLNDKARTVAGDTVTIVNTLTTQVCTLFDGSYSGGIYCVLYDDLPASKQIKVRELLEEQGVSLF